MTVSKAFAALMLALALTTGCGGPKTPAGTPSPAASPATTAAPNGHGVVKTIAADGSKVTIQHGPIQDLGMPAMTMEFQVGDPTQLRDVKAGDEVDFHAARGPAGALVVQHLTRTPK